MLLFLGVDPKNSHSLFLGSYNDMRTTTFWRALEGGEKFKTRETKLVKANRIKKLYILI